MTLADTLDRHQEKPVTATAHYLPTVKMVESASLALLDPEQTAVAPDVAGPLSTLLRTLATAQRVHGTDLDGIDGARQAALYVLDHEHRRVTAEPTPDPAGPAVAAALRDAANQITGSDAIPLGRRQTKEWLRGLADEAEAGRR